MAERLVVYRPVRPYSVNQHYGDNLPCVKDFGLPTQEVVTGANNTTCPVGFDKLYGHWNMGGHNGTDLLAGVQPFFFSVAGTVIEKQVVPSRGLGVGVLSDVQYDFGPLGIHYVKIRYWHLKSIEVEVGDHVTIGQRGGITNNTGYSSGNHLHFELNLFDKDEGGHPVQWFGPNMIAGAIDIEPYISEVYADVETTLVDKYNTLLSILQKLVGLLAIKNKIS